MKTTRTKTRRWIGSGLRFFALLALTLAHVPGLAAAPTITGIGNAASNRLFASPVAQGSIFIIQGSGLGPTSISGASKPFQGTTLSGTSVAVTVGSTTVNALMYYTSDGQVAALLPSNTPTGTGMFTVTYNGQNSNTVNHGIASNNIGLFTIDSTGQGPGILTYPDYSLVSTVKASNCGGPNTTCGAANPGDTLILWGTGLGPVTGDDASGAGLGQNMPNLALSMWVGGLPASVIYQGRSGCCVGEDQIVFTVPNNVPTGCAVPLVLEVNGQISNTAVMPIANGGRSCTPVNPALAPGNVEQNCRWPFHIYQFYARKESEQQWHGILRRSAIHFRDGKYHPAGTNSLLSLLDCRPACGDVHRQQQSERFREHSARDPFWYCRRWLVGYCKGSKGKPGCTD